MSKVCAITGKTSQMGGRYSNRVRATQFNPCGKKRRYANLQRKSYYIPELDKKVTIYVSTRGMKTINKKGTYRALKDAGVIA
ncbi:50S ribosomal protein L28 [Candidatus Nomurabacteria bacterium]|nr:50S ribosomal protein L28 [Candidatus Nomurabacteria bacterium]